MTKVRNEVSIPIVADTSQFSTALVDLQNQSRKFGSVITDSLKSAVTSGKSFEDVLKSMALKLSNIALDAGLKPLENLVSGAFGQLFSGLGSGLQGSFAAGGSIVPFAKGGVVSTPTFFNAGSRMGVMGEAGAEAIMPLSRGADGALGVRMQGASQPTNVVFNISTPDVEGFRKSEGQISAQLARTLNRSRRSL